MNSLKPLIPYEVVMPVKPKPFITQVLREEWANLADWYTTPGVQYFGLVYGFSQQQLAIQAQADKYKPHRRAAWRSQPVTQRSVS